MPQIPPPGSQPSLTGLVLDGRIELLSVLGVGAYGVVYLAIDHGAPNPTYLAVKCLQRKGLDERQRHFQRREIALHSLTSSNKHVVTIHRIFEDETYVYVVLDFFEDGDLFGMITERQRYVGDDELIRDVFLQIIDAVSFCHSLGIFHRDLKPENILCTEGGRRVCLADFGLATTERYSTDFGCGSTFYLSPECQGGLYERVETYSTAANDIWSLGVILVNLTCGRNPWRQACPNDETFRAYVGNRDFLRTILPISHATNTILKGVFALDPAERIDLATLREQVRAVKTFTMTNDELRHAHAAARSAAAAVRPIPPPADPAPVPVPMPVPVASLPPVPIVPIAAPVIPAPAPAPVVPLAPIPQYVAKDHRAQQWQYVPAAPTQAHRQPLPPQIPHSIPARDHQRYVSTSPPHMVPNSSQSSSSGEGDMPPTPEVRPFEPFSLSAASHFVQTYKGGKVVDRPDMLPLGLHDNPYLSVGGGYFM